MSQTYTSSKNFVSDGDVTTYNPKSLVGEGSDINILSAQARWRGVTVTEDTTTTSTEYKDNNDDFGNATATGEFGTEYVLSVDVPTNTPSGCNNAEFENHRGYLAKQEGSDIFDVRVVYARLYKSDGTINDEKTNFTTNPDTSIFDFTNDHVSEPFNQLSSGAYVEIKIDVDYDGAIVPEAELDELLVYARTEWSCSTTTTTTYKTQDPSVSQDVSASYSGTLEDGEWSPWQSLTGLEGNVNNDFQHSISGSNQANFEFEFVWEFAIPDPTNGTVGFADVNEGVWKECAVADTNDDALDYNHITVYNEETGDWGALDVVDLDNPDSIDGFEFYHPDLGWLAPREYSSSPIQ